MRKILIAVCAAMAACVALASTVTNYVVVISNIYNRIGTEHYITNNIKNTHANYYETNHIHTIEHQTIVVERTNLTVNADVSQQAIAAAMAQADRAEDAVTDAQGFASAAASSATAAASSASSASESARQAYLHRSSAQGECAIALETINDRIAWFEQHSGETITVLTNLYQADAIIYNPPPPGRIDLTINFYEDSTNYVCAALTTNWTYYTDTILGYNPDTGRYIELGTVMIWGCTMNIINGSLTDVIRIENARGSESGIRFYHYTNPSYPQLKDYCEFSISLRGRRSGYWSLYSCATRLSQFTHSTFMDEANPLSHGLPRFDFTSPSISTDYGNKVFYFRNANGSFDYDYQSIHGDRSIRDRDGKITGYIMRESDLLSFSNWVERTFQKK